METEKKLRIGTIMNGLLRAHNRLKNDIAIQKGEEGFNQKVYHINSSICELLFWVNANDEWHCSNNKEFYSSARKSKENGVGELLGLKHAYNASKHNMSYLKLFGFEGTKDFMPSADYKIEDSSTCPVWINCPDDETRNNQVQNYRDYLKGEKVLSTFNGAITFLNKKNSEVIFKQ